MTDLVLINSPMQEYAEEKPSYNTTAPIGLGYLATITSNSGINTKLLDAEAEKLSTKEIIQQIQDLNPRAVGINSFSTNSEIVLNLLRSIDVPFKLIGGPYATLSGENIHESIAVVQGEAERVIVPLLNSQEKGFVRGLQVKDIDTLPFVNRSFFINDPYLTAQGLEASISSSRGCIYNCVYCSVPSMNQWRIRSRSIGNVLEEITLLKEKGVQSFHFVDDIFNFSKKRVSDFCDEVINKRLDISWRALCRTDNLDEILLNRMREAGCYKLGFGVESASPNILRYIGKSFDLERTRKIFKTCKQLKIQTKGFFTIGYPGETPEEIRSTINFALELNPEEARFMVVRAFPGTRLYEEMQKKGIKNLDSYFQFKGNGAYVKYHVMNAQSLNGMPIEELDKYIKTAYMLFKK